MERKKTTGTGMPIAEGTEQGMALLFLRSSARRGGERSDRLPFSDPFLRRVIEKPPVKHAVDRLGAPADDGGPWGDRRRFRLRLQAQGRSAGKTYGGHTAKAQSRRQHEREPFFPKASHVSASSKLSKMGSCLRSSDIF